MRTTGSIGLFLLCISYCINFTFCDPANNGGDGLIWDFAPIALCISVQDAQGNDLLNPLAKGSITNQGIKTIYKGETYGKDTPLDERIGTYMAYSTGLQTGVSKDRKYYLTFGKFNSDHTSGNEKVEIDRSDGKGPSVITFSSKLTWKSKKKPILDRKFYLDGQETDQKQGLVVTRPSSQSEQKFDIVAVEYDMDIEADKVKEKIKVDLESKSPYANGELYNISIQEKNPGIYTLLNSDGFPITEKESAIEEAEAYGMYEIATEMVKTYRLIPPDDQIYSHIRLELGIDTRKSSNTFNIFIGRPYSFWIYEDLTEYCKGKYPDGRAKEIIRLLRNRPNNPAK